MSRRFIGDEMPPRIGKDDPAAIEKGIRVRFRHWNNDVWSGGVR